MALILCNSTSLSNVIMSTPVAKACRIWLAGLAGFAKMMRSGATPNERTLLISVLDAQSNPVPKAARTSNTVRLSLHLTAEMKILFTIKY